MVQHESGRKERVQRALSRAAAWRDAIPRGLRVATVGVLPPLAWLWSHHHDSSGNGYILAVAFAFFFAGRRMAIVALAEGLPLLVLQIAMSGSTLAAVVIRS